MNSNNYDTDAHWLIPHVLLEVASSNTGSTIIMFQDKCSRQTITIKTLQEAYLVLQIHFTIVSWLQLERSEGLWLFEMNLIGSISLQKGRALSNDDLCDINGIKEKVLDSKTFIGLRINEQFKKLKFKCTYISVWVFVCSV